MCPKNHNPHQTSRPRPVWWLVLPTEQMRNASKGANCLIHLNRALTRRPTQENINRPTQPPHQQQPSPQPRHPPAGHTEKPTHAVPWHAGKEPRAWRPHSPSGLSGLPSPVPLAGRRHWPPPFATAISRRPLPRPAPARRRRRQGVPPLRPTGVRAGPGGTRGTAAVLSLSFTRARQQGHRICN